MINILEIVDKFFCRYLGLEKQAQTPNSVTILNKNILVSSTESFKRHKHHINWASFASENLKQLEDGKKNNLGIAMGKAIAKHLIISFDEIEIR